MIFRKLLLVVGVLSLSGFIPVPVSAQAAMPGDSKAAEYTNTDGPFACEVDLIEVMFVPESKVRLRQKVMVDEATNALMGVNEILSEVKPVEWYRICDVPEEKLDELQIRGEANTGKQLYNLNNIYRLKISAGKDIWSISAKLEALPGILLARPVPKPMTVPVPTNYQPQQNYEDPAASTPTGIDAEFAWTQTGGNGSGITICDLEYAWNTAHQDISKLAGSQINPNTIYTPSGETDDHGTAVTGVLVSDNNGWGTTGICHGATLKTCGTYYYDPIYGSIVWNVPGAIGYAIASLSAGDVILLENQWDYSNPGTAHPDFIPIEWWLNYHPNAQTYNGVYAAIQTAVANGIHVVEAGGNGGAPHTYVGINTDLLSWYGNSGAIIVGAGGVYPGGSLPYYPEGDLEKLNFSSYGVRYDLQGWGENVVTTGYGHLYSAEGKNLWYTNQFAGTSSASPIVAGAIVNLMSYGLSQGWSISALTPSFIRNLLISTGTPQIFPPAGNIGPRPNLLAAFQQLAQWADVTSAPLNDDGYGYGAAWGDYDNDGDPDLYIANNAGHTANKLFRNDGGGVFTNATSGPLGDASYSQGVAWADYDNDGDLDLYVGNENIQPNRLFRNDGGGVFTDAATAPMNDAGNAEGFGWADYDNDGHVDLYVNNNGYNKLFHNSGDGTFSDATSAPLDGGGYGSGMAWGDYDNDGDLDIYQGNYGFGFQNYLYRNDGSGVFTDVTTPPLDASYLFYGNTKGVAWGDYDNDGDLDLYVSMWAGGLGNRLFRNDGGGAFTDVTTPPLNDNGYGAGIAWVDYDNDGDLDIFVANGGTESNKLFRNDGGGVFADATVSPLDCPGLFCNGVAFADYDSDGDMDLYVTTNEYQTNRLFRNNVGSLNHWLHIKLVGTISNAAAIGARVKITTPAGIQIREVSGGSGYCSQNSLEAAFGLGPHTTVNQLEVFWPSGAYQSFTSVAGDNKITITEPSGVCDCVPGECNGASPINILDIVYLINFKFKGGPSPAPYALCSGDPNYDCIINILDIVYLVNYKFKGGPAPCDCATWTSHCGPLRK